MQRSRNIEPTNYKLGIGKSKNRAINPTKEDQTMRKMSWIIALVFTVSFAPGANAQTMDWRVFDEPVTPAARAAATVWKKLEEASGRNPAVSGDVHRYGFPRSDLTVTLDGVTIKPALALGGWVAFKPMHGETMVMGDLVLLETEINPVMLKLIEGGLEITAVHNHLLRASPATFYMHVGGHGDPAKMAALIHDALATSKTPMGAPTATTPPPAVDLDTAQLDQLIGVKGQANGGVYQFNVPRREPVTEDGMPITPPAALTRAFP